MTKKMYTVTDASARITAGERLLVAGSEAALAALPKGQWIGGTIPYFMGDDGGTIDRERVYLDVLPEAVEEVTTRTFDTETLPSVASHAYDNGFSVIIIPATSDVHLAYAKDAADYEGIFLQPIVGWISGVHLDDLGSVAPKVFDGATGTASDAHAVVLYAKLREGVMASADIVNLFEQSDGDTLVFDETGFSQSAVRVNGEAQSLAEYLASQEHDARLPLVADYHGAMINVSIESVADDKSAVNFYAPLFAGVEYKLAAPVADYVRDFQCAHS